jgi:flagellar biosynthesis anti-sigma factor FlgM
MTAVDGINSLQEMLGALQVGETSNVGSVAAAASAKTQVGVASSAGGGSLDSASLSAAGGLAAQTADLSDVRMTKVAELRQAIAGGNYNVPASAVADKMVEHMLG